MRPHIRWVDALCLVFLLNVAYIAAFATPSIFYMANVLLHLALGLLLAGAIVMALRSPHLRPRGTGAIAAGLFFVSAILGAYLVVAGSLRANRWALEAHIGAGAFA